MQEYNVQVAIAVYIFYQVAGCACWCLGYGKFRAPPIEMCIYITIMSAILAVTVSKIVP